MDDRIAQNSHVVRDERCRAEERFTHYSGRLRVSFRAVISHASQLRTEGRLLPRDNTIESRRAARGSPIFGARDNLNRSVGGRELLGAHTNEVLTILSYNAEQIARMRKDKIV